MIVLITGSLTVDSSFLSAAVVVEKDHPILSVDPSDASSS